MPSSKRIFTEACRRLATALAAAVVLAAMLVGCGVSTTSRERGMLAISTGAVAGVRPGQAYEVVVSNDAQTRIFAGHADAQGGAQLAIPLEGGNWAIRVSFKDDSMQTDYQGITSALVQAGATCVVSVRVSPWHGSAQSGPLGNAPWVVGNSQYANGGELWRAGMVTVDMDAGSSETGVNSGTAVVLQGGRAIAEVTVPVRTSGADARLLHVMMPPLSEGSYALDLRYSAGGDMGYFGADIADFTVQAGQHLSFEAVAKPAPSSADTPKPLPPTKVTARYNPVTQGIDVRWAASPSADVRGYAIGATMPQDPNPQPLSTRGIYSKAGLQGSIAALGKGVVRVGVQSMGTYRSRRSVWSATRDVVVP